MSKISKKISDFCLNYVWDLDRMSCTLIFIFKFVTGNYEGLEGIIIGYGYTKVRNLRDYPCVLQEAKVKIFLHSECEKSDIGRGLAQKAICAGKMSGGVDACDVSTTVY